MYAVSPGCRWLKYKKTVTTTDNNNSKYCIISLFNMIHDSE